MLTIFAVLSATVPAQNKQQPAATASIIYPATFADDKGIFISIFSSIYDFVTGNEPVRQDEQPTDEQPDNRRLSRKASRSIVSKGKSVKSQTASNQDGSSTSSCVNPGGTGGCFATIQGAIDAAGSGDTINVAAGTYAEEIVIDKQLTILGPNATVNPNTGTRGAEAIIIPVTSGPFDYNFSTNETTGPIVVTLDADGVIFNGFTINGDNSSINSSYTDFNNNTAVVNVNGANPDAQYGIFGPGIINPNATISNNIVRNTGEFGINLSGDANFQGARTSSTVSDNLADNILGVFFGQAIRISENAVANVSGNVTTRAFIGITTENFHNITFAPVTFTNNNLTASGRGVYHNLHYAYTDLFTYSGNTITSFRQNPAAVSSPDFLATRYSGFYVESIAQMVPLTLSDNTINANRAALTDYTRVRGTLVTNTGTTSPNILITENRITNAIRGISHAAPAVTTYTSNFITANVTGVYVGTDESFDGLNASSSTGAANVNFNYIVGNLVAGITNEGTSATTNAINNFYGCNTGAGTPGCDTVSATANAIPFAMLDVSASPSTISNGETSTVTAKFISSDTTNTATLPLPDGIPVVFTGDITPTAQTVNLSNGTASVTYTDASTSGDSTKTVTGTVANASDSATITVDDPSPTVLSVTRGGASQTTMASSVTFTVTFSEAVTGVTSDDFTVTKTGNLTGGVVDAMTGVTGSGTTYMVTVSGISTANGNGTVGLDVNNGTDIVDAASQPTSGFTGGETFTVVMSAPADCDADAPRRTYNVVTEFSLGGNPNCEFTYGNTAGPNTTDLAIDSYDDFAVGQFQTPGIDGWFRTTNRVPGVYKNNNSTTTQYVSAPSVVQPNDVLNVHPGQSGERSVVRFTVPAGGAGSFSIAGSFLGIDTTGTTTDVSILVNDVSVFSGNVSGYNDNEPFNIPVINLAVGDTVDFRVGFGNGSFNNDSTGLSATLTAIANVQTETLYGVSGTTAGAQNLVVFNSGNLNNAMAVGTITGLQTGETILAIDVRPATGQLYGLGSSSRLYTISTTDGTATQVGTAPFATLLNGTQFGFDFNPTVDRIRVVSDADQNLRLNPNNGALAAADTNLNYNPGTSPSPSPSPAATPVPPDTNAGQNPNVTAAGYTNNISTATTTTLYDIDSVLNILATQAPPNSGTLNTVGSTGADVLDVNGFDISGLTGVGYVASGNQLYTINLATGTLTLVGPIGAFTDFTGLSAAANDVAPAVTINQAATQPDPTNLPTINFTVVFTEPVTGFTSSSVNLSGTAGATTATVTGSGAIYNVAVSGMTQSGTVIATIAAGAAMDPAGNLSTASTSTDNTVTFFTTAGAMVVDDDGMASAGNCDDTALVPNKIQTAINLSSAGDIITVCPGTYVEELNIDKQLTILGPNATIDPNNTSTPRGDEATIIPTVSDPDFFTGPIMVSLRAQNITFSGFTLDGNNPNLTSGVIFNGVDVDAAEGIDMPDNNFTGLNNPKETISNNIIKNIGDLGIALGGNGAANNDNSTIQDNRIDNIPGVNYGGGIYVGNNAYTNITGNVITRVSLGIVTENFSQNGSSTTASSIDDNEVQANRIGIRHNLHYTYTGPGFVISDNTITSYVEAADPTATRYSGIRIESINTLVKAEFSGNTITPDRDALLGNTPRTAAPKAAGSVFYDKQDTPRRNAAKDAAAKVAAPDGAAAVYTRIDGIFTTNTSFVSPNVTITGNSISNALRGISHNVPAVLTVNCNNLFGNDVGIYVGHDVQFQNSGDPVSESYATGGININQNNIVGNPTFGVQNDQSAGAPPIPAGPTAIPVTNAMMNFWGAADGPGPVGPGSGDKVTTNVNFSNFLTTQSTCSTVVETFPTVTIEKATTPTPQADPTSTSPINFTVVFSEPVTGFATGDVTVSGSAFGPGSTPSAIVTSVGTDGTTYNVAVSGMTRSGTVTVSIPVGVASNAAGNPNSASTSTDNTVFFNFVVGTPGNTVQPVNPVNITAQSFGFVNESINGGTASGAFVTGPATPPAGNGSAQLTVDVEGRENIATNRYGGTRLADLSALQYSAYSRRTDGLTITLQFDVDYNLSDTNFAFQNRLVYEPAAQGISVTPDMWQTFDTLAGEFYASGSTNPGAMAGCTQANPCTRQELLTLFPNVGIYGGTGAPAQGGLYLRAGGPTPGGMVANADRLVVGVNGNQTTFDFEPSPPTVSINDVTVTEGNSGTNTATFTVSIGGLQPTEVRQLPTTVTVTTGAIGDTATAGSDYVAIPPANQTVTIPANQTSAQVTVTINGDTTAELDETFTVTLSNALNAAIADGTGIGTITNDDPVVTISGNIKDFNPTGNTNLPGVAVTLTLNNVNVATDITDANGNYSFSAADGNVLPSGGNYQVTPTPGTPTSGKIFDPNYRTYTNLTVSVTDANFIGYDNLGEVPRKVRFGATNVTPGNSVTVPIKLNALGNESSVAFSFTYDTARLSNPVVTLGADAMGSNFTFNTSTPGTIGLAVSRPGSTFGPMGTKEIVRVTFSTTAPTTNTNTPLTFTDSPTARFVRDVNANPLLAQFINGFVVFAQGIEADVHSEANPMSFEGDGDVDSGDLERIGNFIVGNGAPDFMSSNQFQRADSEPVGGPGGPGDGDVDSGDFDQTGRYIVVLDPLQPAGGPAFPNPLPPGFRSVFGKELVFGDNGGDSIPRVANVTNGSGTRGNTVTVAVQLNTEAGDKAIQFSLDYDTSRIANPQMAIGSGATGAFFFQNTTVSGKITALVQYPPGGGFATSGVKQVVTIQFTILPNAPSGAAPITFSDTPTPRQVRDTNNVLVATNYINGMITVLVPTASSVEVSGRVIKAGGKIVSGATVTLTDAAGNARSAATGKRGQYRITELQAGQTYIVSVFAKGYVFAPQAITVNEELTDFDLTLQE